MAPSAAEQAQTLQLRTWRDDREKVRASIWVVRKNVALVCKQIEAIAIDAIGKSLRQASNRTLKELLLQELGTWELLKERIKEGGDKGIKEVLDDLKMVIDDEKLYLPNTKAA